MFNFRRKEIYGVFWWFRTEYKFPVSEELVTNLCMTYGSWCDPRQLFQYLYSYLIKTDLFECLVIKTDLFEFLVIISFIRFVLLQCTHYP